MKKRGVDITSAKRGGSFDYQDGELEGAIHYVLAKRKEVLCCQDLDLQMMIPVIATKVVHQKLRGLRC
jgi:hypothetical protein